MRCGTRLFEPPSSSFSSAASSSLLLPLLLPPLGSVQMAEAGRPDLGGFLAEQHLSSALERAYRSHDLATCAALLPTPASLLSQVSHEGQTYSWCMQCRWQLDSILIESPRCSQEYSIASQIYSCYVVQLKFKSLKLYSCPSRWKRGLETSTGFGCYVIYHFCSKTQRENIRKLFFCPVHVALKTPVSHSLRLS